MTNKFKTHIILPVFLAVALAGCAVSPEAGKVDQESVPARTTPFTASEFWGNYQKDSALEVNPAASLTDLYKRSEQIVLGSVIDAEAGPSNPVKLDDGTTDANGTTILTVKVNKVLAGPETKQVKVWISNVNQTVNNASEAMMPTDSLMWFLRPSEEPGIMYSTTRAGIIGNIGDGKLATILPGTDFDSLGPGSISTLEQLAESISAREAAK